MAVALSVRALASLTVPTVDQIAPSVLYCHAPLAASAV